MKRMIRAPVDLKSCNEIRELMKLRDKTPAEFLGDYVSHLMMQKDFTEAAQALAAAESLEPNNGYVLLSRLDLSLEQRNFGAAKRAFKCIVKSETSFEIESYSHIAVSLLHEDLTGGSVDMPTIDGLPPRKILSIGYRMIEGLKSKGAHLEIT